MAAESGAGSTTPAARMGRLRAASGGGPSPGSSPGLLEAGQVRAMFDRIAGVYDPHEHGDDRRTAPSLARARGRSRRVGPGSRVLDVATGTGDLAIELGRRVAPGGEVVGSDFSEGMLARARAKAAATGAGGCASNGPTRWQLPYADDSLRRRHGRLRRAQLLRSAAAAWRRWRASCGREAGSWCWRSPPPHSLPLSIFYRLWFDRLVPALGRSDGSGDAAALAPSGSRSDGTIADAYTYLPDSVRRFPAPDALAAEMERAGCARSATCSPPAGSSRSTPAPFPCGGRHDEPDGGTRQQAPPVA